MEKKTNPLKGKASLIPFLNTQKMIRAFFHGNALMSIIILVSICVFLAREGFLFFPKYQEELTTYRNSGQEYVDYLKDEVDEGSAALSILRRLKALEQGSQFEEETFTTKAWNSVCYAVEKETEDLIDDWEDLQDELDDFGSETEPGYQETFQKLAQVKQEWQRTAAATVRETVTSEKSIKKLGVLPPEMITKLSQFASSYDPVEETPPAEILAYNKTMKEAMKPYDILIKDLTTTLRPLKALRGELTKQTLKTKTEAVKQITAIERKAFLEQAALDAESPELRDDLTQKAAAITIHESFPYDELLKPLYEQVPTHLAELEKLRKALPMFEKTLPNKGSTPESDNLLNKLHEAIPHFEELLASHAEILPNWSHATPLPKGKVFTSFFLGQDWTTNSTWQDFYGFLPLLAGSLLISFVALAVSVPISIAAAIYVNQISSRLEQNTIKPTLEFIQAIPSVVLGFLGITMLGPMLHEFSHLPWLSWIPGFPLTERLNILNAGLLLALMAIPTIFTLCEDALNNVPSSYTQAALSLGSSKIQTIFKVVLPAAISGVLAAVLLGFGRVIGETMVVLLVAGNRIEIPDFTQGLTVFTQPAHTMTGIIAQEMGEVSGGSLHWRALFLVGLVLFTFSLSITIFSQQLVNKKAKK